MSLMDKIKNKLQMGKGRGKEEYGRATRDPYIEAKGRGERAQGGMKQAGEHIKDVGKNIRSGFKK
jgi:uncharacterized protein YjbJ (UPF0337 family)